MRTNLGSKFGQIDGREQVNACVSLAERAGLDFLVLDQTRPDIEVPVVRVIVPGLRHFCAILNNAAASALLTAVGALGSMQRDICGYRLDSV